MSISGSNTESDDDKEPGWIQTYSGLRFYPTRPDWQQVNIEDIARALSRECRFGGHCIQFLSVAEHCVHAARAVPERMGLYALMHDAAEAYLKDIPRPLKSEFGDYRTFENNLMIAIAYQFSFIWPFPPDIAAEVWRVDNALLSTEREQNMVVRPEGPEEWGNIEPALDIKLEYWDHERAFHEFMGEFHKIVRGRHDPRD